MTKSQYEKTMSCLQKVNKMTLGATTREGQNTYRTEYKHQIIELDDITLILSGSITQFYGRPKDCHSHDKTFLVIQLFDSDNQELKPTIRQHAVIREKLRKTLTI